MNNAAKLLRVLMAFSLMSGLALPRTAAANGMTTHALAGERVIDSLQSKDFANILRAHSEQFFNGVLWPDAIQQSMQQAGKSDDDKTSHGRTTTEEEPKGWTYHYLEAFRDSCAKRAPKFENANCRHALAFLAGALTHMVVDGPWHGQFIDHSSRQKCDDDDLKGGDNNNKRHSIADANVDYCLERRLRGDKTDFTNRSFRPATYVHKADCTGSSFYDLRMNGECWECPKDTDRTAFPITTLDTLMLPGSVAKPSPKGCVRPMKLTYKKAKKKRKNTQIAQGCPEGQFWDVKGGDGLLGACYECTGNGYGRSAFGLFDDKGRACVKTTPEKYYAASYVKKQGCSLGAGEFAEYRKDTECWTCPEGHIRNPLVGITTSATKDKAGSKADPYPDGCVTITTLPCSKQEQPGWAKRPKIEHDPNDVVLGMLKLAYDLDGKSFINKPFAKKSLEDFRWQYNNQSFGAVVHGVKAYGGKCDWIYENAFTGRGGINDGISDTVKLLDLMWTLLKEGRTFQVLRTATYKYSLVEDGKVLLKTRGKF